MASKSLLSEEDLSCPVCCDIFMDPVLLSCSHSVCRVCLEKYWFTVKSKKCPVCRVRLSSDQPTSNLVLKNLCEAFLQERRQKSSSPEEFCSLHEEKFKLFCLEDKQPLCLVCRDSKKHRNHDCYPIEEVVGDYKEELRNALKPVYKKLEALEDVMLACSQTAEHIKIQVENTEKKVKDEFEKLHKFLQDEESARLSVLRKEEEQKFGMIEKKFLEMTRGQSLLSDTISIVEEEMKADDMQFLQNFEATKERAQCTLRDPEMVSGALINVAKHLDGLKTRVWEKMLDILQ